MAGKGWFITPTFHRRRNDSRHQERGQVIEVTFKDFLNVARRAIENQEDQAQAVGE